MPKSIFIDPKEVRKSQILKINDIPINQYKPDIKKEIKKYGEEKLLKIYYDMLIIREFESMLNSIKIQGSYEGIAYNHLGPAHLSIGQESSAVGQCVHLSIEDFIFGSHRSHGEVFAKCFSAIDELEENELLKIMKSYMDGACLKVVEKEHKGNIKSLAQ
ncbi:MAG: dehydrogenase, partial [Atribacterota bacterium]|nr:dehydrogenase [Atribacterota bacterium]